MTRLVALLALLAATGVLAASPALSATGPGNQKKAIQTAALDLLPKADRKKAVIQGIRISTVSKYWALASVNAKPAYRATFQSFLVVLVKVPRIDDSTHWVVADFGSAFVGCDVAPDDVLDDLYRETDFCAPEEQSST